MLSIDVAEDKCIICQESNLSEIEGYEELCLPCACLKMDEELQAKWNKELLIYKKRTGQYLDFDTFSLLCFEGKIERKKLRGLPELIYCYDTAIRELEHYNKPRELQLSISFQSLYNF